MCLDIDLFPFLNKYLFWYASRNMKIGNETVEYPAYPGGENH